MKLQQLALPLAIAMLAATPLMVVPAATAAPVPQATAKAEASLSADQIRAMLVREGYSEVKEMKLDDGQWQAKAKDDDGDWDTLHLDARSGHLIDGGETATMGSDDVLAKLKTDGYSGFSTLKFDNGEWQTTAMNAASKTVELTIDANGKVIKEKSAD